MPQLLAFGELCCSLRSIKDAPNYHTQGLPLSEPTGTDRLNAKACTFIVHMDTGSNDLSYA